QLSTGGARDLVNVGLEMASLADSTQACQAHEIGFQHLAVLARAKRQLGDKRFFEAHLLAEAKEISVGRLWHRCQELRHAADPEAVEDEQRDAFERRELTLNQHPDGTVTLGARLDPVSGAVVKAAIAPLAQRCGRHDDRRLEQRQADALVEVCGHALEVGGGHGRRRPHLNVSLTCGTLLQVPESPAASTDYGALLPGVSVKRIACDCNISRQLFDTDSLLLEVGRAKRVVSPALRRVLVRRDQHCRWPGCTRPASWCEAHHVVHWIHGGGTGLENLVLLCWRHHWLVHEGRWHLVLDTDGEVHVLKPPLDLRAPPRRPSQAEAA